MRKAACVLGTLLLAVSAVGTGLAAYPDRPVKLIVPWAAGGDTDNIFRPFGPALQKHLGGTVVIANVGGASGALARPRTPRPTATHSTPSMTTSTRPTTRACRT